MPAGQHGDLAEASGKGVGTGLLEEAKRWAAVRLRGTVTAGGRLPDRHLAGEPPADALAVGGGPFRDHFARHALSPRTCSNRSTADQLRTNRVGWNKLCWRAEAGGPQQRPVADDPIDAVGDAPRP